MIDNVWKKHIIKYKWPTINWPSLISAGTQRLLWSNIYFSLNSCILQRIIISKSLGIMLLIIISCQKCLTNLFFYKLKLVTKFFAINFATDFIPRNVLSAPHRVLSMILNHWLPGSHLLLLSKHLHSFVTMLLSESMSKQTLVPSSSVEDKCILESEIASHFELVELQIMPSFACFPKPAAWRQKYVPLIVKVFWGVYAHGSASEHGAKTKGSNNATLFTHNPVSGWKINLCGRTSE